MILPYLTSPTRTRCRTTPTPKKRGGGTARRCSTCRTPAGLEVRQVLQRLCDAGQDLLWACEPALDQGNFGGVRGPRLKIQAGCRPIWSSRANSWSVLEVVL
jgi:hypothetical protein